MSEDKSSLTRRRVLGGLATIGAASAAAGAGTMAYFSDTEESTGNTVSAGTLDLKADGGDSAVTTINVGNVAPGDPVGSGSTTLKNSGSIDGSVDLMFGSASNWEGTNTEPENDTGTTDSTGELGDYLQVEVYVGSTLVRGDFSASSPQTFNQVFDGTEADSNVGLAAGGSKDLQIKWKLPSGVGNEIQGDSVSGNITIELNQTDGK